MSQNAAFVLLFVLLGCLFVPATSVTAQVGGTVTPPATTEVPDAATDAATKSPPGPKKTWFFFAVWPNKIVKYDPVIDEVVERVETNNGMHFGVRLRHDRKKFHVTCAQRTVVEVIDVATMKVEEEHPFVEKGYITRVDRVMECPGGTHWYVKVNRIKAELDRYKIEKEQWWHYDVANKKVLKKIEKLPRAIRSGARISPCGTKWHIFGSDIKIINPETLKEEGKIELSKPLFTGMGPIRVRGDDYLDGEDPDHYRFVYSMRDPVKTNRTVAGLVDIDIKGRKITQLKEWGADTGVFRLYPSKDKKIGVATRSAGGGGRGGGSSPRETKMLLYDLETGKKKGESVFQFRPRRSLSGISPDGKKVYVGGAGNDFDIYGDDFQLIKTVTFEGDLSGRIYSIDL